jgi:hypothetical protein
MVQQTNLILLVVAISPVDAGGGMNAEAFGHERFGLARSERRVNGAW